MIKKYTVEISLPIRLEVTASSDKEAHSEAVRVAFETVTPEMVTEAWALWAEQYDATEIICAEPQDSVWVVLTNTLIDGFVNCWSEGDDEKPSTYATKREAQKALVEHLDDMLDGGMEFDLIDFHIEERMASNTDEA